MEKKKDFTIIFDELAKQENSETWQLSQDLAGELCANEMDKIRKFCEICSDLTTRTDNITYFTFS